MMQRRTAADNSFNEYLAREPMGTAGLPRRGNRMGKPGRWRR